ncbi:MAG: phosphomannomutase/phosphoglucomutase [Patescibacteria group bacterium]|nr:phosphomannomutase/phosphoglucomutase [Patescibacteria group bacterium]MDD4610715.1 phosphomannomutase/phosphoglucomutase [Patescibacteria group bacterium]
MKVNPYIFRGYDLRGVVDKDLNPEIVEHLGRAHGTLLKKSGITKAVVGYDCRRTSKEYADAIIKGLAWAGIDCINIGMNLVGTFYWSQYYLNAKGGVFVTASHNPAQYNGFKFANDFSETLVSAGMQELRKTVEDESYQKSEVPGKIIKQDVREAYFDDLAKRFTITKKFKVVVDPTNSTAGVIMPDLLRKMGCEVIESNCNIDPKFPLGTPDPTETIVAERLKKKVLEEKADIGFSYDPDGDRIGIVDEKGTIIWNDVLVALFAIDVLNSHPGDKIMFNILCSKVVEETIKKYGGTPFMWRVGHSFLKKKNQEIKAAFIGELSGHFFFSKDFYNHDDGAYSTLRLLQYLSRTKQTLHEAVEALPQYISSAEIKVGCADELKAKLIDEITKKLKIDWPQAEIIEGESAGDGVRLNMEDSMFVVRYSQNGPYLTVKFEANTEEKYRELRDYISKLLHGYLEIDWTFGVNVESLK